MKLIQFTAFKGWRGHEQKIIYLYEAFRDYGYVKEQWIVCSPDSEIFRIATEKGLNVIGLDYKSEYDLKFAKKFKKLSDELGADLVFLHSSKAHTLAVFSKLLFGLKMPLVLCRTMIERVDTNFFRKWKYNYKGIKKIICVSQPVVDILKFAVKDHSRLSIVGSVTDVDKFIKTEKNGMLHREFGIPYDYKIIGNIAAFSPMKDHHTWINTVAELHKRGLKAKYILIGKGGLETEIRKMVADKGLQDEVIFAGFRTDIPQCLPEFDLLLFTSNNEPTGGVILESYACRVPVVASNAGGIPTILKDNETGFLARSGDPVDFANKVEALLYNGELREKFTKNGYDFLMKTSTKEVIAKEMYDELLEVHLQEKEKKS